MLPNMLHPLILPRKSLLSEFASVDHTPKRRWLVALYVTLQISFARKTPPVGIWWLCRTPWKKWANGGLNMIGGIADEGGARVSVSWSLLLVVCVPTS